MKKRLADAQTAAKSFLNTLEAQDKAQVIRFSRDVSTIYPLGSNRAGAGAAIDSTMARGDTALWDALYASLESLRTVAGRKAIVLLSDGVDDDGTGKPLSKKTVADVLALARQVNVPIYAIGLGTELDEINLKKVATDSGALYLNAADPAELKRLYDSIGKQLAGQYTIYYTSNLPSDGSEHRLESAVRWFGTPLAAQIRRHHRHEVVRPAGPRRRCAAASGQSGRAARGAPELASALSGKQARGCLCDHRSGERQARWQLLLPHLRRGQASARFLRGPNDTGDMEREPGTHAGLGKF